VYSNIKRIFTSRETFVARLRGDNRRPLLGIQEEAVLSSNREGVVGWMPRADRDLVAHICGCC
jgi:hypothetical protein